MNDEEIRAECERLFQAGGPKVYLVDRAAKTIKPSPHSGAGAVRNAFPGIEVWRRVKSTIRYDFNCVGRGK